jgi:serpin B
MAAVAALLFVLLSGCGGGSSSSNGGSSNGGTSTTGLPSAVAADVQRGAAVDSAIVNANNGFGFALLQQLDGASPTQNTLLSPASVALALEIAYSGAAGTTQTAMSAALELNGLSPATVNSDNAALQASLVSPDPAVTLSIANSLWTQPNNSVLPAFVTTNTTYYGAQLGSILGAPANVNAWASAASHGTITQLLPAGDYSSDVAILANVIYFAGKWSQPFDATQTANSSFTTASGATVTVPMMHTLARTYAYVHTGGVQAVKLPYGTGRLAMIVLLPDASTSWSGFLASLTASSFATWVGQMSSQYGTVALPKFTLSTGEVLNSSLTALGMGIAFQPGPANFSGIGPNLYIQNVFHKVYLQVDEQGTVASGGTGVVIAPTAEPVGFEMTIDHPFVSAIQDTKTGEILFLGAVTDPSQS